MDLEKQIGRKLNNAGLLPEQRKVLERWDRECDKNNNNAPGTRRIQLTRLVSLAAAVQKPFADMNREDIEAFIYSLELETGTVDQYKISIKKFFKWFCKSDSYPEIVKWIKLSNHRKTMLPDDILTPDEVKAMILAADNPRDRAFVSVMYESAARNEEMVVHEKKRGNVQIPVRQRDIVFDNYGAVIILNGKTGMRRIRLIRSAPDLKIWLNHHPERNDNAPLWVGQDEPHDFLSASRGYTLIRSIAKKAKISKNVHPHLLRHTRLTEVAGYFKEADLKVFAGWSADSKMASVYIHRSGADVERTQLEAEGIITREEKNKESNVLKPIICPRCKDINPSAARFCSRCGMPLDAETAENIDKRATKMNYEFIELVLKEPRLLEILKNLTGVTGK